MTDPIKKGLFVVTILILFVSYNSAFAWIFGPSNYDECISEYTKHTESDRAVTIIAYACKHKFKEKVKIKYADCIFDYVPRVMTDRAAIIIAYACKYKYIENTRIKYANCILDEVPGVKTDRAATVVAYSCKNKHP